MTITKKIKRMMLVVLAIIICVMPMSANAKTVYNWTSRTTALKTKVHGSVKYRVKANTRVVVVKAGKKWVHVRFKNKDLYCLKSSLHYEKSPLKYEPSYLRKAGAVIWKNRKYTYYTERILPGHGMKIPGRHHDKYGFVCDKDDYIVVGSNTANRGKIIATPFGKFGKVYDAGYVGTYLFDCYTNW